MASSERWFRVTGDTNVGFDFKGQILEWVMDMPPPLQDTVVLKQPSCDMDGRNCAAGGTLSIDRNKAEEAFRCFKLTPKTTDGLGGYDYWIFGSDKTWGTARDQAEWLLDQQLSEGHEWDTIGVNIECVWMTQADLDELETNN